VDGFVLAGPHMCDNLDNGICNFVRRSSTLVLEVKNMLLYKVSYNPTTSIAFKVSTASLDQRFTDNAVVECQYSAVKRVMAGFSKLS
jgi:hypothetical protein